MAFFQRLFINLGTELPTIELDARIAEQFEASSNITDHPVDTGLLVSDHIYRNPRRYTLEGAVSDTPVGEVQDPAATAIQRPGLPAQPVNPQRPAARRSIDAYQALLQLWQDGTVFDVQTHMGLWRNLTIQALNTTVTQENANMLHFTASLRELIRIDVQVVNTSPVADEGLKQTPQAGTDVLNNALNFIGRTA